MRSMSMKSQLARKRRHFPWPRRMRRKSMKVNEGWSYYGQKINGEPILPLPKKQIGDTCNHHASVVCLESRWRLWHGRKFQKFPALSIQHAIDSVVSNKTRDVLIWLSRHGVTTEDCYAYEGNRGRNRYRWTLGWPLHAFHRHQYIDAKNMSNNRATKLILEIKSDGPILARFLIRKDYDFFDGKKLYEGKGALWKPRSTEKEWAHVVTITGYGFKGKERYFTYMNSYGLGWGEQGNGKIAQSAIDGFFIPYLTEKFEDLE